MKRSQGLPPRLADRRLSTGERQRPEVATTLEPQPVEDEELPAPDIPRRTAARPVERDPNRRSGQDDAGIDQARDHVRVVVLDGDARQTAGQRPSRRGVVGVEIVGHRRRRHAEEPRHLLDHLLEVRASLESVEVAHVRPEERLVRPDEAHRVLELRADGHQRRSLERKGDSLRDVPPRATDRLRLASDDSHHRVVRTGVDLAVVREEAIGDARQALARHRVVPGDRLLRAIPAGHDQDRWPGREEQMVQRSVRQHHPELVQPRRHPGSDGSAGQGRREDDGPGRRGQRRLRSGAEADQRAGLPQRAHHQRQRLARASLPFPEPVHRRGPGPVDGKVVSADALHRDDASSSEGRGRGEQRGLLLERWGLTGPEGDPGTAHRARHRLGVEAAASGILVLGAAGRAEGELHHRRPRAVVGEIADDGVARPAVGAVDERIAVPPIGGIFHLPEARLAGGDVGRDDGAARGATRAVDDDELAVPARLERAHLQPVDAGERGRSARSTSTKRSTGSGSPSTSIHTPSESFRTSPVRPSPRARRYTVGRNPTPCTAPEIRTPDRASVSTTDRPGMVLAVCARDALAVKRAAWRSDAGSPTVDSVVFATAL